MRKKISVKKMILCVTALAMAVGATVGGYNISNSKKAKASVEDEMTISFEDAYDEQYDDEELVYEKFDEEKELAEEEVAATKEKKYKGEGCVRKPTNIIYSEEEMEGLITSRVFYFGYDHNKKVLSQADITNAGLIYSSNVYAYVNMLAQNDKIDKKSALDVYKKLFDLCEIEYYQSITGERVENEAGFEWFEKGGIDKGFNKLCKKLNIEYESCSLFRFGPEMLKKTVLNGNLIASITDKETNSFQVNVVGWATAEYEGKKADLLIVEDLFNAGEIGYISIDEETCGFNYIIFDSFKFIK